MKSHVVLESSKLSEWCRRVVKNAYEHRMTERNELIYETMATRNYWRRWFLRRPLTRDEVKADLKADTDPFAPWQWINTGAGAIEVANRLMIATEVSDRVTVVDEDLQYLHGWSPKNSVKEIFGDSLR